MAGLTPFPPSNGLSLHVVFLGLPAGECKTSTSGLVLQVLLQQNTSLLGGALVHRLELIQQRGIIRVPGLIVGENRAVVGVGIVQTPFLREGPNGILYCRS